MIGLGDLTLPPDLSATVATALLILTRLSMMLGLLPAIGELIVPIRVRMAVVLALTAALVPLVLPEQKFAVSEQDILVLLVYEVIIGGSLGFAFRVLVFALMTAGTIISQSMSLSQIFGAGVLAEPNPSISMLLSMAGAALFVTVDFHTRSVGLLAESYALFPLGDFPDTGALAQWATAKTASAFSLGVSLAMPFILIGFLYNAVLGLINQAMPQMMVTFVGIPANVFAGMLLLAVSVGIVLTVWLNSVEPAFGGFWR